MGRISDFQLKDIVNVANGKKLGNISDINLNLTAGTIESIVISRAGKILGLFGKEEEIVIPWAQIVKIGEDVILVRHSMQSLPTEAGAREE
ncbi:YlmC/YmxH family sporulation protein [Bacillus aerolatus]|uniref:YlmC/YmxH family sporulation protein n=1 Tax=Bacillus aerolatus TaxID=2653354 RepID=A0A6I1FHW1_9BACI|nr:YlmC/YmxH family sporulation protein [Bacillus aerolatus]KAB7707980.1 YlmC/YmxH family sporulation protein [Bacillus aerolatus]